MKNLRPVFKTLHRWCKPEQDSGCRKNKIIILFIERDTQCIAFFLKF